MEKVLIIILIAGKLILVELPINWLTTKVTYFVIDFRRSCCTVVYSTVFQLLVVVKSNKDVF